jgi:multiple sugar transport system permease protein
MFKDTISGRRLRKKIFIIITSILVLVYILAPIYWIVNTSFQRETALEDKPPHFLPTQKIFTLSHYTYIFTGVVSPDASVMIQSQYTMAGTLVFPGILNSLIVSVCVTLINVLIGFPAGHVFARYRFLGDKKVFLTMMATRLLPSISLVIPMFILLRAFGLFDTKASLVCIYSAITIPFTTWIMRAYFANIPLEYEEAARLDGCGYVRSLIKVVIPLARPGIIAAAIFTFMASYEEFVFATILTHTMNSKTQSVVLAEVAGAPSVSHGMVAAAATLSFIPPVLIAIIFRKQVLDGLTARLGLS